MNNTDKTIKDNSETKKSTASLPGIFTKLNKFTLCFISVSIPAMAGAVTALVLNLSIGLVVLGVLVMLLGAVAAFSTGRFCVCGCKNNPLKFPKITKIGIIILVISLVLGICSLAFGIVMCISTEDAEEITYTYDFAKSENIFAPDSDKICTVKVSPESAGMYTVRINGAALDGITNGTGNKIYPIANTNTDGECYSVFLIINTDYFFKLHTTDAKFSIEIEEKNEPQ